MRNNERLAHIARRASHLPSAVVKRSAAPRKAPSYTGKYGWE